LTPSNRSRSRFSEPQIVHILRQAEVGEKTIGHLHRDHGTSLSTFYRWRRRSGGEGIPELRRQRHLEPDHARHLLEPSSDSGEMAWAAVPPPDPLPSEENSKRSVLGRRVFAVS
jgi:putative transposase